MKRELFVAALLAAGAMSAGVAQAQTKGQIDCINTINKDYSKLEATQAKDLLGCLGDWYKLMGVAPASTLEHCLLYVRMGKVGATLQRLIDDAASRCQGNDGEGAPLAPDFGPSGDGAIPGGIGVDQPTDLLHDVFGADLDAAILASAGPTLNTAKCQQAVARTLAKCSATRTKTFLGCLKTGLRGDITDDASFAATCLMQGAVDTTGQSDERGKIAKACSAALAGAVSKKCVGVDLATAFPGLVDATAEELDRSAACRACLSLSQANEVARDCDLFDNAASDLTCVSCVDPVALIEDQVPDEVCVPPTDIMETGYNVSLWPADLNPPACTVGEGCRISVAVDTPVIDYDAGTASFGASVDGSGFVARAELIGVGVYDCTATVLGADVAIDLTFDTVPTRSGAVGVDMASQFTPTVETLLETEITNLVDSDVIPEIEASHFCLY